MALKTSIWTIRTLRLPYLLVTTLVMFAVPGRALLCFHCNSAGRPGCADPFDADSLEPLACDPPPSPVPGTGASGGGGFAPDPHPDAETFDASLEDGVTNASTPTSRPTPSFAADALYFDLDAPPVVRCLKEERAVSETASVVLRTCVLVAEDTPEFGCSPHPAALHCSLCAEDECNAAPRRPAPPPPLALLPPLLLLAPRC